MPRGDGTGPNGMGPRTGRAAGYCTGNGMPGYLNRGAARGWGGFWGSCMGFLGRGGGRGYRNRFFATGLTGWQRAAAGIGSAGMSSEQEVAFLHNQSKHMEEALQKARERIAELENEGTE